MTPELDKKICEKYPKIFCDRQGGVKKTLICFGLECGDGWYEIIDKLCASIQAHVDELGCDQVVAKQVKEKFGGLRFYVGGADDVVYQAIGAAEEQSFKVCEDCGLKEGVTTSSQGGYWIRSLCVNCRKNR